MPSKNSPDRGTRRSIKQAHSPLTRRLVPLVLIFMVVLMTAMILVALAVVTGLIQT